MVLSIAPLPPSFSPPAPRPLQQQQKHRESPPPPPSLTVRHSPETKGASPPPSTRSKLPRLQAVVRKIGWSFIGGGHTPKGERGKDFLKAYLKKFDADEVEVLRKVYKELSARNPGAGIDKATFLQYFPLPGLWGERLFQRFDYKSLGAVDYEEFLVGVAVCCRGTRCERIHVLFQVFDLNGDGVLQKEELVAMLSNLPNLDRYLIRDGKSSTAAANATVPVTSETKPNNASFLYPALAPEASMVSEEPPPNFDAALDRLAVPDAGPQNEKFAISYVPELDFDEDADLNGDDDDDGDVDGSLSEADLADEDLSRSHASGSSHSSFCGAAAAAAGNFPGIPSSAPASLAPASPPPDYVTFETGSGIESPPSRERTALSKNPRSDLQPQLVASQDKGEDDAVSSAIDVEAFVDKIIEECEFSESDSLTFMEFKTWLEKNDAILAMFNDCLHEEAWGLQGNALYRRTAPALKSGRYSVGWGGGRNDVPAARQQHEGRFRRFVTNRDSAKGDPGRAGKRGVVEIRPDAFYKVKRLFTVPARGTLSLAEERAGERSTIDTQSQKKSRQTIGAGTAAVTTTIASQMTTSAAGAVSLSTIASSSGPPFLFKSPANATSPEENVTQHDSDIYPKQTREVLNLQLLDLIASSNPNVDLTALQSPGVGTQEDDILACPACGSLLVVCPRCHRRFPRLRLSHGTVVAECQSCLDGKVHQFSNCWHCNWSFAKAVDYVDQCEPLCEGVLYKIGRHTHKWRRRYFVLVDNLLYYYNRKEDTKPQGFIFLEGCFVQAMRPGEGGTASGAESTATGGFMKLGTTTPKYGFSILHGGGKLPRRDLYAATEAERKLWIDALRNAMKQQDIADLYTVQQLIGQGKFSVVHKAVTRDTQQVVAIKFIDKSKITGHERELLRSEIAILRLLHHPHVISFREILDTQTTIHLVMEFVAGGELYDLLQQRRRLPELHVNRIVFQLLSTVAYLHKCGIIHRDLKPENILLTDGTVDADIKITDFGLSCICGPDELVTQPCGTLAYVAPEVLTLQGYNHKVDVWSVGVIMYLLLRGRLPFPVGRPTPGQVAAHYQRPLTFEGPIWDNVCSSAKDLLRKLLQPNPEKRISAQDALQHIWLKNPTAVMISEGAEVVQPAGASTALESRSQQAPCSTQTSGQLGPSPSVAELIDVSAATFTMLPPAARLPPKPPVLPRPPVSSSSGSAADQL